MRWNDLDAENCSLSRAIAVIGDRWSLLILRDCFLRIRRFEDFQTRLGITRHILAARLRKLVSHGVLRRVPYNERPLRYEYLLTQRGLDLYPVILSLVHWGDIHLVDERGKPVLHRHKLCGKTFDPVFVCSECGEPLSAKEVEVCLGPGALGPGAVDRSGAVLPAAGSRSR
ncbi:MAG: winged helix-turn-helix transcriptional regulator [Beijerinckiaceae bacterium]